MTKQQTPPSPTTAADPHNAPLAIIAERFKTKLCRGWLQHGYCPYQSKCMFAHGEEERRTSAMNVEDGITTEEAIREFKRQQLKKRRQLAAAAIIPAPRSGIRRPVGGSAASVVSAPAVLCGGPADATALRPSAEPERFANLHAPLQSFERSNSSLPDPTQSPSAVALQPLRPPPIFFTPLPQPSLAANGRTAIISFPRRPSSIVEPPVANGLGPMCNGGLDGSSNCSSANPSELWDVDDYPQGTAQAPDHHHPAATMMRRRSSDVVPPVLYHTPPNIYLSWEEAPSSGSGAVVPTAGPMAGPTASRTPSMTLGISATSDDASAASTSSKNVRYRHDPYGWNVDARSPDMESSSWT